MPSAAVTPRGGNRRESARSERERRDDRHGRAAQQRCEQLVQRFADQLARCARGLPRQALAAGRDQAQRHDGRRGQRDGNRAGRDRPGRASAPAEQAEQQHDASAPGSRRNDRPLRSPPQREQQQGHHGGYRRPVAHEVPLQEGRHLGRAERRAAQEQRGLVAMTRQHGVQVVEQPALPREQRLRGLGLQRDAQRRLLAVAREQRAAVQGALHELGPREVRVDPGVLHVQQIPADVGEADRRAEQQRHLEQAVHGVHPGHPGELHAQPRDALEHEFRHQVLAQRPVGEHEEVLRPELAGEPAGEGARGSVGARRLHRRVDAQAGYVRTDDQQQREHHQQAVPGPRQQQPLTRFQPSSAHRAQSSSRGIGMRHRPRRRGAATTCRQGVGPERSKGGRRVVEGVPGSGRDSSIIGRGQTSTSSSSSSIISESPQMRCSPYR
ncbi:MAG: hypothetical protein IPM40_15160 [Gammaproteobacteria bacterium]|nr:hypothetical protein [Gammaproteobacteria bacterium]